MSKEQRVVDPAYLFFEAAREPAFITGSQAVAEAVKKKDPVMFDALTLYL